MYLQLRSHWWRVPPLGGTPAAAVGPVAVVEMAPADLERAAAAPMAATANLRSQKLYRRSRLEVKALAALATAAGAGSARSPPRPDRTARAAPRVESASLPSVVP
eukprot:7379121-Prymnesium_polylepis.1